MMIRLEWRGLVQRSLLGGLGGLCGWAFLTLFASGSSESWMRIAITGGLIGGPLGVACGLWRGLLLERSWKRALQGSGPGLAFGIAGGIVGGIVGEVIFGLAGGGLVPRSIGWSVFGAAVGAGDGIARKTPTRALLGTFGGLLGGLFGGSTYQFLAASSIYWLGASRDLGLAVGGATGLTLLGMFLAGMIGLVEDLLRSAWLTFTSGRLEGRTVTLDPRKPQTVFGRSELADVCLSGEPSVALRHAVLATSSGSFRLEPLDGEVKVWRGGAMQTGSSVSLQTGDTIQLGEIRARFESDRGQA
jgi:hypothetical protein